MSRVKDHIEKVKEDAGQVGTDLKERASGDLDALRTSFNKLREDVMLLVGDALKAGRNSKDATGKQAHDAVDALKGKVDQLKGMGSEHFDKVGSTIKDNPLAAAIVAFGIGFIASKFLTRD